MKKRILSYLLVPLFMLTACSDWLDVVPEEDIATIDSDFETYAGAYSWLKSCYIFLQNEVNQMRNVAFWASDEMVADDYLRNVVNPRPEGLDIITGLQSVLYPRDDHWFNKQSYEATSARDDYYTAIVMCNHFITRIDNVYNLSDADKKEWKAEVKALKAFFYFELMRRYGPIVLVPDEFDPNQNVEDLKLPRSHVDTCFNAIVRLCDEAMVDLPAASKKASERRAYFNKEATMALKARALCYQASDLFNGNPDYASFVNKNGEALFSKTKDLEKWKRAADAAIAVINYSNDGGGATLKTGSAANTPLQSYILDIETSTQTFNYMNNEVLLMIKTVPYMNGGYLGYTLPNYADGSIHSLPGACFVPTMKMVEMFYTEDGLPIDQDLKWVGSGNFYSIGEESDPKYTDVVALNEPVLNLHRRREPRFYADIAADRCFWRLGSVETNIYKVEAYQGESFGLKDKRLNSLAPQNITGYWMKKWCSSKANLANHQSNLQNLGESPVPIFRLAEMYLIAAEALNEYKQAPDAEVYKYLNVIRKRAGIPDVEVSWRNAKDPNKVKTQVGMREIIHREWNIEFAFEGYRYWNVRRWKTANIDLNERVYGWNVVGNNATSFYNNGKGPVVVFSGNKFVAPRDYFYPIRSEEVQTSGYVQNLGW
ncbi:RagB/SusD family nutrient uptake outer membrane protein [Butyricimonas synergistica]|uniref:RagB/SusD family nutrient uptake outer membrane protein n=1 Tax=Butyricimonas synergistica TaxID=544644 RepID=UPI0003A67D2C|nr:RagB/SusD family nutrient uptake outer membrane protein [Butyricimonas synergistica]